MENLKQEMTTINGDIGFSEIINWWEQKRFWYNIIIGGFGIGLLFYFKIAYEQYYSNHTRLDNVAFYAHVTKFILLINLAFSTGYILEYFCINKIRTITFSSELRLTLLVLGYIISLIYAYYFSTKIFDDYAEFYNHFMGD
jgi:hypothetical protein